ncbi:MAG: peptidase S41, partial [Bacteroidota bacterium]
AEDKGVEYVEKDYQQSRKYIDNRIKAYIGRRLHNDAAFFPVFHQVDNVIQEALKLMPKAKKLEETGQL